MNFKQLLMETADLSTVENLKKAIMKGQVIGIKPSGKIPSDKVLEKVITSLQDVPEQYKNASIILALNKILYVEGFSKKKLYSKAYELYFRHKKNKDLQDTFKKFEKGEITETAFIKKVETTTKKVEDAEKLFENDTWLVVIPKTFAASCKYGAGTKWCTTGSKITFDGYNKKSTGLIILINKKTNEKYQTDSGSNNFFNALDRTPDNVIEILDSLPEQIKVILKNYKINIWNKLLIDATIKNNLNMVKKVLDKGADVHAIDDYALRYASAKGYIEVVKLLLDKGADVHAIEDEALRYASAKGYIEVVKLLLDKGANIHAIEDEALRHASLNGHIEVVKLLLDKGANIHARKDEALRFASVNGHIEVFKLLKQYIKDK